MAHHKVNGQKTYKREASFAMMSVVVALTLYSAWQYSWDPEGAQFTAGLAKFMFPWATALMASMFGMDWWGKQGPGRRD